MAVRLTAKGALAREILRLGELRGDYLKGLNEEKDKAARREYKALLIETDMRTQVLRYALNFLEGEEEIVCLD